MLTVAIGKAGARIPSTLSILAHWDLQVAYHQWLYAGRAIKNI
jgi:hypothetical protein